MSSTRLHGRRANNRLHHLSIEQLEERCMLATLTVNSLSDIMMPGDGLVSLREAVFAANNDTTTDLGQTGSGTDTIEFAPELEGTIQLSSLGQIEIMSALSINGPGPDILTITAFDPDTNVDGNGNRVFLVTASGVGLARIAGLRLTGGDVPDVGGAVLIQEASIELSDLVIEGNQADSGGGVSIQNIYTGRLSAIRDCVIAGNGAREDGGGLHAVLFPPLSELGEQGQLIIQRTTIADNRARVFGGGANILLDHENAPVDLEVVRIEDSTISGNIAYGGRGPDEHIDGSRGIGGGGGIHISHYGFRANSITTTTITNSTISGNRALNGGGIYISGAVHAGIGNRIRIRHTTVASNKAGPFDANEYPESPPASRFQQPTGGGGILFTSISGTLTFPDFPNTNPDETILFDHSIVANNEHLINEASDHDHFPFDGIPDDNDNDRNLSHDFGVGAQPSDHGEVEVMGEPLDSPYYVFATNFSIFGRLGPDYHVWNVFDLVGTWQEADPLLEPLADNGGPTLTHAPIYDPGGAGISPAIDAGDPSIMAGGQGTVPEFDQRGAEWTRVYDWIAGGTRIDIGAVELQPAPEPEPVCAGDFNGDGRVDAGDYVRWRNHLGEEDESNINFNGDGGGVTISDYQLWKQHYGAICGVSPGGGGVASVPGDYNGDGVVDLYDLDVWHESFGSTTELAADGNNNGIIDLGDLAVWQEYLMVTTLDQINGDFNADGVVDMADYSESLTTQEKATWEANFGMTRGDVFPIIANGGQGMPLEIAGQAPRVENVTLSGSNSTHPDFSFASVVGSGEQLRTVPIGGIDTVSITFSEEVLVTLGALNLTGMQSQAIPSVSEFTYDVATQTASWVFEAPLPFGQYVIQLSDSIYDLDHEALDGEYENPWRLVDTVGTSNTFPSGDGVAGGEFRFRFTNLPADFDHDNDVDGGDLTLFAGNYGLYPPGSGAIHGNGDADGDGDVDSDDLTFLQVEFGLNYKFWPSIEPAMILVSNATDENDTDYSFGDLSLREALAIAAANPGRDTIVFHYTLFGAPIELSLGQLTIASDVDILGPGAEHISIDGNEVGRIFEINNGVDATLRGVTITGGKVTGNNDGGAIRNSGTLTLDSVVLVDNEAGRLGGAVYSTNRLTVINSTFSENSAGDSGGAISIQSSMTDALRVEGSTFVENEALQGAAVRLSANISGGTATIVNSTFSGNSAFAHGGAIRSTPSAPALTVVNSTITLNQANTNPPQGVLGEGGGIYIGGGSVTLFNSIVSANTSATAGGGNIHGALQSASDYNLLGSSESSQQPGENNVYSNDPGLAALADNGGPTWTHALLSNSLAVDAGSNSKAVGFNGDPLAVDQRGFARHIDSGAVGPSGGTVDIGAFEYANGGEGGLAISAKAFERSFLDCGCGGRTTLGPVSSTNPRLSKSGRVLMGGSLKMWLESPLIDWISVLDGVKSQRVMGEGPVDEAIAKLFA